MTEAARSALTLATRDVVEEAITRGDSPDAVAFAVLEAVPNGWARVDDQWVHIDDAHVVEVHPGGEWMIEHSLTCRLAGMLTCPVDRAMRARLVADAPGRYRAAIEGDELVLGPATL